MTAATCPVCLGLFAPLKGGHALCPAHRAARLRALAERTSLLDGSTATATADEEPCQPPPAEPR
ncbi:hypothetical protein [Mycobacterium interjectum]|uniref:hypothetical protein n=1 Tax=Mycobacterium interjectum TaxID=33895 RepID=UPI000834FE5F|nr:hypothetical protein [Mycobacterium interjectum]MCV7089613.1 hypothetical protein [Mycobacterium interjectum]